jgi:YD repeat-containing protein
MKRIIFAFVIVFAVLQASAQTSVSYTYDNLNRLTEVSYSNGVKVKYTYDALGNRTSKTVTSSPSGGSLCGDVDGDGKVNISDVTALIDYLLTGNTTGISLENADCDQDGKVNISDVTTLIDYLLTGHW